MTYIKQGFSSGQILKADHLNHIEDGIANIIPSSSDKPNQQFVTDNEGNQKWEDKIGGYKTIADIDFLPEDYLYKQGNLYYHYGFTCSQFPMVDKTYTVILDGNEYNSIATFDGSYYFVGNRFLHSSSAQDTGEPFCILFSGLNSAAICRLNNPSEEPILSMRGPGEVIVPISGEYIAGGLYAGEGGNSMQFPDSLAKGFCSFATGYGTEAAGVYSSTFGLDTKTLHACSAAFGKGTTTTAQNQIVQGSYNIEEGNYAHIVGNGKRSYGVTTPSNAYTLDWDGNSWFAGDIKCGGTGYDDETAFNVSESIRFLKNRDITFIKQGSTVKCVISFEKASEIISSGANSANITLTITSVDSSDNLIVDTHKMVNIRRVSSLITGETAYYLITFRLVDGNFVTYQFNPDESVVEVSN